MNCVINSKIFRIFFYSNNPLFKQQSLKIFNSFTDLSTVIKDWGTEMATSTRLIVLQCCYKITLTLNTFGNQDHDLSIYIKELLEHQLIIQVSSFCSKQKHKSSTTCMYVKTDETCSVGLMDW